MPPRLVGRSVRVTHVFNFSCLGLTEGVIQRIRFSVVWFGTDGQKREIERVKEGRGCLDLGFEALYCFVHLAVADTVIRPALF